MFSPCACFISTALPYVQDSFKELGLAWPLPACSASRGDGEVLCCKSWIWRRSSGFTVLLASDGGPVVCCPSTKCQYVLTYCLHIMLGGCRGGSSAHHVTFPFSSTNVNIPLPPLFHSHCRPGVRGSHACTTASLNIVLGTEPSITEKTLSSVLWANN